MPHQTASDYVADHLRREILAGRIEPGERLGVAEFAEQLHVSQTPVREAFKLLAMDGLVQLNAYRGARVAALSADEYEEIFTIRVPLEELAARQATPLVGDSDIAEMERALDGMRSAAENSDIDAFLSNDRAFHRAHYMASGRERLWERIITLRYAAERYTRIAYTLPGVGMPETFASHSEILRAVVDRDTDRACATLVRDFQESFGPIYNELLRRQQEAGRQPTARTNVTTPSVGVSAS